MTPPPVLALVDWQNVVMSAKWQGFSRTGLDALAHEFALALGARCNEFRLPPPESIVLIAPVAVKNCYTEAETRSISRLIHPFEFVDMPQGKNMADMELAIRAIDSWLVTRGQTIVIVSDDTDLALVTRYLGHKRGGGETRKVLHVSFGDRVPTVSEMPRGVKGGSLGRQLRSRLTHALGVPADEDWLDAALHLSFLASTLPFTVDGFRGSPKRPRWRSMSAEMQNRVFVLDSILSRIGWKASKEASKVGLSLANATAEAQGVVDRASLVGRGVDLLSALGVAGLLHFPGWRGHTQISCRDGWHDGLLPLVERLILKVRTLGDGVPQKDVQNRLRSTIITSLPGTKDSPDSGDKTKHWRDGAWDRAINAATWYERLGVLRVRDVDGKRCLSLNQGHPLVDRTLARAAIVLATGWGDAVPRDVALSLVAAAGVHDGAQYLATLCAAGLLVQKDGIYRRTSRPVPRRG